MQSPRCNFHIFIFLTIKLLRKIGATKNLIISIFIMHSKVKIRISHISTLFFVGLILVCLDIINIDMGGFKLKVAYVGFGVYLIFFSYALGAKMNKDNALIMLFLLICFFPSVVFSINLKTSSAFFAGTAMCMVIMLVFARMTYMLGMRTINLLFNFYRFSVILTAVFVITRLQERGHFLFYEPSYYAIALIPYFCLIFYRTFSIGVKSTSIDLFLILLAIIISQSASMVIWSGSAFLVIYFQSGRARVFHFAIAMFLSSALLAVAYQFNERVQKTFKLVALTFENPEQYLNLVLFVVGNRLQRVLIAWEAFIHHLWFGVGLGSLKQYSINNFKIDDFSIGGMSASDFTTEMNATNVFLELGAEGGLIGLIGYCVVLYYIHSKKNNMEISRPFKTAFYLTMATLLIESSYLRPYVWALYGMIIGLSAISREDLFMDSKKNSFLKSSPPSALSNHTV